MLDKEDLDKLTEAEISKINGEDGETKNFKIINISSTWNVKKHCVDLYALTDMGKVYCFDDSIKRWKQIEPLSPLHIHDISIKSVDEFLNDLNEKDK